MSGPTACICKPGWSRRSSPNPYFSPRGDELRIAGEFPIVVAWNDPFWAAPATGMPFPRTTGAFRAGFRRAGRVPATGPAPDRMRVLSLPTWNSPKAPTQKSPLSGRSGGPGPPVRQARFGMRAMLPATCRNSAWPG